MCRHLAYVGGQVLLRWLLVDPPNGLSHQAWAPRRQSHGVMNVDGFGVGWYVEGDPEPLRHRGEGPIWADETFADLARGVRSGAVLAAVRSATDGMSAGRGACAPFRDGPWLFSHNGALDGWPHPVATLAAGLDPAQLLRNGAPTDSGLLWLLTRDLLERAFAPDEAVREVHAMVRAAGGGRVNLLLTQGRTITASASGASLCWRTTHDGVVVASEPYDDEPGWHDVPDEHVLTADVRGVELAPL